MKILHIGKFFPPFFGGIESFMAELLPELKNADIAQVAMVHQHQPALISKENFAGLPLYRASCFGRVFFAPFSPWFFVELWQVLRQEQPDILHLHLPNTSVFWALLLPAARKLPWVIHWHSDVIGDKPKLAIRLLYPVYQLFERWLLKKAAAIVCTSPTYLASSKPLQPFKHKCVVIPLGLAALADTNATLPVDKTEAEITLRLLVVGRLAYYKGHKYLFEALALLPAGRKVEVVLVGSGELRRQLEQQVQQLKLRQVTFVGSVSDTELKRWYAWCDCLCLPSIERTEAFGMVIIEAARQGKPAIVTGVPGSGMAWVVQHNKTGWVVPPADSQALAMQLRQLIHHPELATQAGYNACQRFKSTFSIKQVALKLVQLYHQLVPNTK